MNAIMKITRGNMIESQWEVTLHWVVRKNFSKETTFNSTNTNHKCMGENKKKTPGSRQDQIYGSSGERVCVRGGEVGRE